MGLTQAQFAQVAGVGTGAQNRYEAGATEPSASYFAHLAGAGVDVIWLLTGQHAGGAIGGEQAELLDAFASMEALDRAALLQVATSLSGTSARHSAVQLPTEAALLNAFQSWLSATPGLTLDELPHELATMLPSILQGAADELPRPASDRAAAPPVPPTEVDDAHRAAGQGRRSR